MTEVERNERENKRAQYLVIRCFDRNAGFTALLTYALNGMRIAEQEDRIPVVLWDEQFVRHFFDSTRGDNVWNYFFGSAGNISYAQLHEGLLSGAIRRNQVRWLTSIESYFHHSDSPDRIATFWNDCQFQTAEEFFRERRTSAQRLVDRHIEVAESIRTEVERIESEWNRVETGPVWGVHIRGTDLNYTTPVGLPQYFHAIRKRMAREQTEHVKIWLATDQVQFLEAFRDEFGEETILSQDCLRGRGTVAPFKMEQGSNYDKGREVLIDILALSRCTVLFKGPAAVGEAALWFNPGLEAVDLTPPPQDRKAYSLGAKPAAIVSGVIRNPLQKIEAARTELLERHVYAYAPDEGFRESATRLWRMFRRWRKLRKAGCRFRDWDSLLANLTPRAPDAEDGEPGFAFPEGSRPFNEVRAARELLCPLGVFPDGWTRSRVAMRIRTGGPGQFFLHGQSMDDRSISVAIDRDMKKIGTQNISPGHFRLEIPISSAGTFSISLSFDHEWQLEPPDERIVSVYLERASFTSSTAENP